MRLSVKSCVIAAALLKAIGFLFVALMNLISLGLIPRSLLRLFDRHSIRYPAACGGDLHFIDYSSDPNSGDDAVCSIRVSPSAVAPAKVTLTALGDQVIKCSRGTGQQK